MASLFGPVPSYNSYESETLVNELNMAPEELLEDQVCVCACSVTFGFSQAGRTGIQISRCTALMGGVLPQVPTG